MGEGKWIKTYVNNYDDTPSKMIDAREDRDTIHYVRGRLNALAGKVNRNGELYMTETKPYTIKTLAIEFNRDFEAVKEAIKVLKNLEVIEITEDRVFKITDWEIDQNVEGLERIRKQTSERVARHRAAKKAELHIKSDTDAETQGDKVKEKSPKNEAISDNEEILENKNISDNNVLQENRNYLNNENVESNASCNNKKLNNIEEKLLKKDNIINNIDTTNKLQGKDESENINDIINNNYLENIVHNTNEIINTSDVQDSDDLKCSVTVTQQNKRRGKKRNKKKDKRESKKKENNSLIEFSCDNNDFEISDDNSEDLFCESFTSEESGFEDDMENDNSTIFFDVSENDKVDEKSVTYFEMNGVTSCKDQSIKSFEVYNARSEIGQEVNSFKVPYVGSDTEEPADGFKILDSEHKSEESAKLLFKYCNDTSACVSSNITLNALKYAVNIHTEQYVKMAIDKSIEVCKFNMPYINGILNNWKREGYPKYDFDGGSINGTNSYGKSISQYTGKFEGFKPKKPRELTQEERNHAEKNLI